MRPLAVVCLVAGLVATASPARAGTAPATGASLVADTPLSARLHELTIDDPVVGGTTKARVLLPSGYERQPNRRYPVLYILHGANNDYRAWTDIVDVAAVTAAYDLIVVMPDGGPVGFYSDWYNGGAGGPPQWETYHLVDLRRLLEQRYRIDGHYAVAGQSMGGFGALSYASRHPDMFSVVASFSGAVDTRFAEPATPLVLAGLTGLAAGAPAGLWGDPTLDEVRWRAHNPLDLAPNLRDTEVFVSSGDGVPSVYDSPTDPNVAWRAPLESAIHAMNVEYVDRLHAVGVAATEDIDRPGTHNLSYGLAALAAWMPDIMRGLSAPRPVPDDFTYRSAEPRFSVWGWSFSTDHADSVFTDVRVAGDTVSATGRGPLVATTPAVHRPGGRYVVVDASGEHPVRADAAGRLRFTMDLGDTAERYSVLPDAPGPRPRGPAVAASIRAA